MPTYIIITLLSCVIFSVGSAMQKHGMVTSFPKLSGSKILKEWKQILISIFKNWIWVAGAVLSFIGWGLHFQALGIGDISIVQPLMNTQVLIIVLIGVAILKEKLLGMEWLGILILLGGAIALSITGKETTEPLMKVPQLVLLTISIIVLVVFIGIGISKYKEGKPYEVGLAVIAGLLFGINAIYMKASGIAVYQKGVEFNLSSPEAWQTILSTFYFYVVPLAGLSGFFISQWTFTHGRASIAVPIFTTISMVIPVIAGVFVFQENISLHRILGIIIITIGALFLYRKGAAA